MTNRLIPVLIFLLFFCTGCILPDDPATERAKRAETARGDIIIGAVAPWGKIDTLLWEGIEMGVEEINVQGGLLGRKLRVIRRDDDNLVEKGVAIAQEFGKNPDLVAVLGHYESFVSMPASVVYQYYGVLMLCTVDMDPQLTEQGFSLIFRTVPNDMDYGRKLALFCDQKGYRKMLPFIQENEYGRDFSNAFNKAAGDLGIRMVDSVPYDDTTTGTEIQEKMCLIREYLSLDAILLSGDLPKAAVIISEARQNGVEVPIIGGIDLDRKELPTLLDKTVKDVFVPSNFDPNLKTPLVQRFVKAFRKRYGKTPDVLAAQGYDTLHCLAFAIQKAGSTSPPKMAEALRCASNLKGLTGGLRFTKSGARLVDDIYIKVLENGSFRFLEDRQEDQKTKK